MKKEELDYESDTDSLISTPDEEGLKEQNDHDLDNLSKIKDNERYNNPQLYFATSEIAHSNNFQTAFINTGTAKGISNLDDAYNAREIFSKKNGSNFCVITPPVSDISSEGTITTASPAMQGYSIKKALLDGLKASEGKKLVIISTKISQELGIFKLPNFLGGARFGPQRKHWTHLEVRIEGNEVTATHTDSKGILGRLYSLDKIREGVEEAVSKFNENKKDNHITYQVMKTIYTGKQGIMNNKDCGRYAILKEMEICGLKFKDNKKDKTDFSKIDDACRAFKERLDDKKDPSSLYNQIASKAKQSNPSLKESTSQKDIRNLSEIEHQMRKSPVTKTSEIGAGTPTPTAKNEKKSSQVLEK